MSDYHLVIQPNGGKDDPAAGIGTGPYKMVVNEPGVRHGYEKNANDWKSDRGHADQVEILVINDDTASDKILFGYGSVGNDMPINSAYPYFSDDFEQRTYDPDKAAFHYKKSGHSGPILLRTADGSFPGAVDASQLFQQSCGKAGIEIEVKREPNDGYWSEVWNKQPFCTSYWGGRPTR